MMLCDSESQKASIMDLGNYPKGVAWLTLGIVLALREKISWKGHQWNLEIKDKGLSTKISGGNCP